MHKSTIIFLFFFMVTLFSVSAQENPAYYSDAIFQVDSTIKLGEEEFLLKIKPDSSNEDPLGIVLSGGAARAFAHIGVLRTLEEEGIYPDFIVTNSMGSLVGLLYAAGMDLDTIEKAINSFPTDFLFTLRLPFDGGLIGDSNMVSMLYEIFGDLDVKDLEIPIVVIAEDLASRRQVHFMEGDFYKVLSAAIAMPAIFPPVRYDDMILIDGGVTNLVPVQTAYNYTDKILVSTTFYETENSYRDILSVINRSLDIGKTRNGISETKNIDNILIRCDVENFSFMDFAKIDEIVQKGVESTQEMLVTIKESGYDESTTWSQERLVQLESKRETIREKFETVWNGYKTTKWVPQKDFTANFMAGFNMYSGFQDDYYLNNSDYGYLSQQIKTGPFLGEVREYWDLDNNFGLDAQTKLSLFGIASLQNRLVFSWNTLEKNKATYGFDSMYFYGKIDSNITKNGNFGVRPFLAWEGTFANDFSRLDNSYGRLGFESYLNDLSFSAYAFSENHPVYGFGIENDFDIKIVGPFHLEQKTVSRFSFDNNQLISLFRNDGMRGSVTFGNYKNFVITNNALSLQYNNIGTLFETLMFNSMNVSAFCDYYKTNIHGFSTGAELSMEMSVVGLVTFTVTGYAGWDFGHEKAFGSISISAKGQ